jgi:hypothetical protein
MNDCAFPGAILWDAAMLNKAGLAVAMVLSIAAAAKTFTAKHGQPTESEDQPLYHHTTDQMRLGAAKVGFPPATADNAKDHGPSPMSPVKP